MLETFHLMASPRVYANVLMKVYHFGTTKMMAGISEDNIEPYLFEWPGHLMPLLSSESNISKAQLLFMSCLKSFSPIFKTILVK